ncbi:MAG: hypothetical protein J6J54_01810 [Bacteroidales bacterium]|nr:hypothetical protein [Bacteroidales bacterium]
MMILKLDSHIHLLIGAAERKNIHDRTSLKNLGKKLFAFSKMIIPKDLLV